jgi:secondary thiamine-phosphate synthase enzyme
LPPRSRENPGVLELKVATERKTQLVNVTAELLEALGELEGSLVTLFVPHTTAGIVVQAAGKGATAVAGDIEAAFAELVEEDRPWGHLREGDANPWSHVRAALTASSVSIPAADGRLALGPHQAVFLAEFDGPRERTIHIAVTP